MYGAISLNDYGLLIASLPKDVSPFQAWATWPYCFYRSVEVTAAFFWIAAVTHKTWKVVFPPSELCSIFIYSSIQAFKQAATDLCIALFSKSSMLLACWWTAGKHVSTGSNSDNLSKCRSRAIKHASDGQLLPLTSKVFHCPQVAKIKKKKHK